MGENETSSACIEVNGWPVWYEKFGTGPRPVLLIPGAIGTGRTDYWEQLEGEDALNFEKFTFIAVEAPGWGRSRPPLRKFDVNVYNNDAQCFHAVMQSLGYNKYSVIGWSDGAKVAMLMAALYPKYIEAMVVTGLSTNVTESAKKHFRDTLSVDKWSPDRIEDYLRSYETKDDIQKLWTRYVKYIEYYNQYFPDDFYQNKYDLIQCPVLVIHGERDQMVDVKQPKNVCQKLKNGELKLISSAGHDFHQKYPSTFKTLCENHFLSETSLPDDGGEDTEGVLFLKLLD